MPNLVPHRIMTTELGAVMAGMRLMEHGYTKFTLVESGHPNFPVAIMLDAPENEEFDYLRPDILPPK